MDNQVEGSNNEFEDAIQRESDKKVEIVRKKVNEMKINEN